MKKKVFTLKKPVAKRSSINAKLVADDVVEAVRKGEKVSVSAIMRKRGYSKHTSKQPGKVTKTQTFRTAIADVVADLELERAEIIKDMKKKRSKAKYRDLTDGLDKVTKNLQLLTGKETENVKGSIIYLPGKPKS